MKCFFKNMTRRESICLISGIISSKVEFDKAFSNFSLTLVGLCNAERRYYEICWNIIHTGMSDQTWNLKATASLTSSTDQNQIWSAQNTSKIKCSTDHTYTGQFCLWWLDQKPLIDNKNFCWFQISYLITSNGKTLNLDYLKFLKMFLEWIKYFPFSIMLCRTSVETGCIL